MKLLQDAYSLNVTFEKRVFRNWYLLGGRRPCMYVINIPPNIKQTEKRIYEGMTY